MSLRRRTSGSRTALTSKHIKELLPRLMHSISSRYQERPDLVLAAWPHVVGEHIASMTHPFVFDEGILHVKVHNSTLYSLLIQNEKSRILKSLRNKFPNITIKTVRFQLG